MLTVDKISVMNIENAVRGARKGYRVRCGKYEASLQRNGRNVYIGTFNSENEAIKAISKYEINELSNKIDKYGLNLWDGVIVEGRYIAFSSGDIFNMYGCKMIGVVDRNGYLHGIINKKNRLYHRIIASAFVENADNKPCVNHIDGNKLNNNSNNLEWCTHSENTAHAYKNGLEIRQLGEKVHNSKLKEVDVIYIRDNYIKRDKHFGAVALSKKFNVDRTTIIDVVLRKTWGWLV